MKLISTCVCSLVIAQFASPCVGDIITSTFDSGLEGWEIVGNGSDTSVYVPSGGNPGGFLQSTDAVNGPMTANAPASFRGNLSSYDGGLFTFDARIVDPDGGSPMAAGLSSGNVTLFGPSSNATLDFAVTGYSTSWTRYSEELSASNWGQTQPQWDALLSNITAIQIVLDSTFENDTVGLDNVSVVPEPSSFVTICISSLVLLRRHRRETR